MKKINKPNEVNNIISMKKDDDIVLSVKGDSKNIIESFYFYKLSSCR